MPITMWKTTIYTSVLIVLAAGCASLNSQLSQGYMGQLADWTFYSATWSDTIPGKKVHLPHKWPNDDISSFGFGMYIGKLVVPDSTQDLSILMPNILSAYTILVDGDTLVRGGVPSIREQGEEVRLRKDIILIPSSLYASDDEIELKILVSNHNYHVGGFLEPLTYGDYITLQTMALRSSLMVGFQAGALGLMSIFLFVYFIFRKKDAYILFFSILSFGLMLRLLLAGTHQILDILPGMDGTIFLKTILSIFYLGITLNFAVLAGLFPTIIPKWSQAAVWIIGILSIAAVVILPLRVGSFTVPFFQFISLAAGVVLIIFTFKAALRHLQGAKTVLIGGSIAFIFLVNDILFNNQLISSGNWSAWGVLIYLILLVIVISRRFSSAMDNEEGLLKRLAVMNQNLENRVQERTRSLEEQRRRKEEEAINFKKSAEELQKFRDEEQSILRTMVHDLKAPFNKIKGLAQIMRMKNQFSSSGEGELNEMILKVAEEGRLLIDDLNVLTMYESHINDHDSFRDVNINSLLEDCVKSHAAYAKSKNIEITYHAHHHVHSYINPHMLSRIIDNLLSNAIKFSGLNSVVKVELIRRNTEYEIIIQDEGPGFTPDDREKMFRKFQRLSARPTQGESSTGLGLSIVKNLTDLMEGVIEVESEPGQGARFILLFPVRKEMNPSFKQ